MSEIGENYEHQIRLQAKEEAREELLGTLRRGLSLAEREFIHEALRFEHQQMGKGYEEAKQSATRRAGRRFGLIRMALDEQIRKEISPQHRFSREDDDGC